MAFYTATQMARKEKPRPPIGWHTMKIVKEMPNDKNKLQHTLILENESSSIWFNCFLNELPRLADELNLNMEEAGHLNTADFVDKYIDVEIKEKEYKGKPYLNVVAFKATHPDLIPVPNMEDIPF